MEGSREEGAHFPDAAPEYVAHISEDGERVESVETHLRQVAQLAKPSLSHVSRHRRIDTESPNHMCASSWATTRSLRRRSKNTRE